MSQTIEELRKRDLKIREIQNQYKLGMHPLLKDPDGTIARAPKDSSSPVRMYKDLHSENTGSPSTSEGKSLSKLGEEGKDDDAKTETSRKQKFFDEFEYHDVIED